MKFCNQKKKKNLEAKETTNLLIILQKPIFCCITFGDKNAHIFFLIVILEINDEA